MTEIHKWRSDFVMVKGDEIIRMGGQVFFPGLRYSASNAMVRAHANRFTELQPDEEEQPVERLGDPEE